MCQIHTHSTNFSTNSKEAKMHQNLKRDFSTENIHIAKWLGSMLAKISILFQDDYFFPLKLVEQASTLEVLC